MRNRETNEERVTQTDNQSNYLGAVLPVGIYLSRSGHSVSDFFQESFSCRGLAPGWMKTVGLVFWLEAEHENDDENDLRSQS